MEESRTGSNKNGWWRDGAVVRTLTFYRWGLSSIRGSGFRWRSSLILTIVLAPGLTVFIPLQKPKFDLKTVDKKSHLEFLWLDWLSWGSREALVRLSWGCRHCLWWHYRVLFSSVIEHRSEESQSQEVEFSWKTQIFFFVTRSWQKTKIFPWVLFVTGLAIMACPKGSKWSGAQIWYKVNRGMTRRSGRVFGEIIDE